MNRRRVGKRHQRAPRALAKAVIVIVVVVFPSTTKGILCGTCRAPVVVALRSFWSWFIITLFRIQRKGVWLCGEEALGTILLVECLRILVLFVVYCCFSALFAPFRVLPLWLRWIATFAFGTIPVRSMPRYLNWRSSSGPHIWLSRSYWVDRYFPIPCYIFNSLFEPLSLATYLKKDEYWISWIRAIWRLGKKRSESVGLHRQSFMFLQSKSWRHFSGYKKICTLIE